MIGIVLVTHTPLAAAFLAAATHVFKNVPVNLLALDVEPDQDVYGVSDLLAQALQEVDVGDGALILSDICGATPANCAAKMASSRPNTVLMFGLNVPMLLRALTYRELPLAQVVQKAIEGGKNGIVAHECSAKPDHLGA